MRGRRAELSRGFAGCRGGRGRFGRRRGAQPRQPCFDLCAIRGIGRSLEISAVRLCRIAGETGLFLRFPDVHQECGIATDRITRLPGFLSRARVSSLQSSSALVEQPLFLCGRRALSRGGKQEQRQAEDRGVHGTTPSCNL
jgi:hypothetical protein